MAYSKTNWVNGQTPINETNLNKIETELKGLDDEKVNKSGDTMTGGLTFNNPSEYEAITKKRDGTNTDYTMILGLGGTGVVRLERREGTAGSGQSLEVRDDGLYSGATGKKLAEQSNGWTNATLTSKLKSTGAIRYNKIGNVVIVNFADIEVNSSIVSHGDILATGLPNSIIYLVSALFNYAEPSKPMRIAITTDGKIQTHYSNQFTASESTGFYGTIVYVTN